MLGWIILGAKVMVERGEGKWCGWNWGICRYGAEDGSRIRV